MAEQVLRFMTGAELRAWVDERTAGHEEEAAYRRGYRAGFAACGTAVAAGRKQAGIEQVLYHLFDFWQRRLAEWEEAADLEFALPPQFVLPAETVRTPIPSATRARVARRCGGRCAYCGRPGLRAGMDPDGTRWEIDHVRPLAAGGLHVEENFTLACRSCNRRKRMELW